MEGNHRQYGKTRVSGAVSALFQPFCLDFFCAPVWQCRIVRPTDPAFVGIGTTQEVFACKGANGRARKLSDLKWMRAKDVRH
jgi:hypothetical protein